MKQKITGILFLLCCMLLPIAHAGDAGILLTTQEWEPYQYTENGQVKGVAVDVVKRVLDELKQPYTIIVFPWKRAQVMAQQGEAQGFFAASRSDERDKYAVMSDTIADQKWVWVSIKSRNVNPKAPDFKRQGRATAIAGSNMHTYLSDNGYKLPTNAISTEQLIKQLNGERVDAILVNEIVFNNSLNDMKLNKNEYSVVLEKDSPLGIYFTKAFLDKNSGFMDRFNAALKKFRK